LARLKIHWRTLSEFAPKGVTTGQTSEEAAKTATLRSERPMMVYVTSDDPTDSITRKLEDIVFANEVVGIGAKFFDAIKMNAGDAEQDRLISANGRKTPRILFVSRAYKVTGVVQGRQLSRGRLLKAMKSLARIEYKSSFDRMVRDYTKLLNELDRLEGRKTKLADDKARLEAKPSPSNQKKWERTRKEYEADVASWTQREKKLLEFKTRGEAKAKTTA